MKLKKILYLTYDGLTDPLGQSQILPYLKGLAGYGYNFTILSFEKKAKFNKGKELIKKLTAESSIEWVALPFSERPPLISKFYDAIKMKKKAEALHLKNKYDMIHCRSYIAADVGLYLKKKYGVKFFFDMRGFWADEKKDGSWNVSNPFYKLVYNYYKKRETLFLKNADQVVILTHAGKNEMMSWGSVEKNTPVAVIPCCADINHFTLTSLAQKIHGRNLLGIDPESLLVSYLGSIGTWYMLDEMIDLFARIKIKYASAKFLILTHSSIPMIYERVAAKNLSIEDFIIKEASRNEVPIFIKASDINISFIKPLYSKISSSPTKLAEVLSMGIPVIVNNGVGDVKEIVTEARAGFVLENFDAKSLDEAVDTIPDLMQLDSLKIRESVTKTYSLTNGIISYLACYKNLIS